MTTIRQIAGFGWRPGMVDPRDRLFNLEEKVLTASQLPSSGGVAYTDMPPIWDQGHAGSCTAHGSLRVFMIEAMKQGLKLPPLSRLEQYYNTRLIEGTQDSDSGAEVRDAIKALASFGVAPESEWPYDLSQLMVAPPDSVMAHSKQHMAIKYQQIVVGGRGAPMRTALCNKQAIVFGFPVPDYFQDSSVWDPASEEPLPVPSDPANVNWIGGHCVCARYFNFSGRFISTASTNRRVAPYFTIPNSWDKPWGMDGEFNMDAQWFSPQLQLASDLWLVSKDT